MTNAEEYEKNFAKIKELEDITLEKLEQQKLDDFKNLQERREEYKDNETALKFINQREEELKKYYKEKERKIPKMFDELAFIIL
nr:MAG TPA: hypothetical protein [Caudoviricetes sp.]